jgi:flagellar export protein FliJ
MEAARALARAIDRRRDLEGQLQALERKLAQVSADSVPARGERVTAGAMVRGQMAAGFYREQIKQVTEQYRSAWESETNCHRELMEARQEEEGLLRLKEKAQEAHQVEVLRADERAVQEFVNAQRRRFPV